MINIPRVTAHRQIQLARAEAAVNSDLRKMLEKRGIRFIPTMPAQHLKIIHGAAQVEKEAKAQAEAEIPHLFHRETNEGTTDNPFADLAHSLQRDAQVKERVQSTVERFLDKQLETASPSRQPRARDIGEVASGSTNEDNAQRIADAIVEQLRAIPISDRGPVWKLVTRHVEAAGLFPETQEVAHVAAA